MRDRQKERAIERLKSCLLLDVMLMYLLKIKAAGRNGPIFMSNICCCPSQVLAWCPRPDCSCSCCSPLRPTKPHFQMEFMLVALMQKSFLQWVPLLMFHPLLHLSILHASFQEAWPITGGHCHLPVFLGIFPSECLQPASVLCLHFSCYILQEPWQCLPLLRSSHLASFLTS